MLWRFVREFPADTQSDRGCDGLPSVFVGVSFAVSVPYSSRLTPSGGLAVRRCPAWLMALFEVSSTVTIPNGSTGRYSAPLQPRPFHISCGRRGLRMHEDRRRVMFFVGALAVGLAPFLVAVVATPFVPALRDPRCVQPRVGVVLYAALATIVPATAYSVAVGRVMDLQLFVRITLRYALARYAVWAVSLGPLAYVGFDVHANQQLTITEYVERSRLFGPLALSMVGLMVLMSRQHLLRAIDRWFRLEPSDHARSLARLERRTRTADGLRGVTGALAEELHRALHATSVAILLTNDDGTELVPVEGVTNPIRRDSALLEILRSTRGDIQLDARSLEAIARLLTPEDREWLDDAGAHVLRPLVGSTGILLGLVVLGRARTGLPYSAAHLALVTAAGSQAAMQIENRQLRGREADESRARSDSGSQGLDWQDEPAAYCPACSLVWSSETRRCSCGTTTTAAALPLFVQSKFRLERLVGAGGMGVVYLAVDMVLDRQVAIKTLPLLRSESADRLQREARTMARVLHPNLALIYGTEQWRGTPMLVVEYLDGGTLRDWIRRGPVPYFEAIELGIVLADVLDRVHASGVLHRDVKPSNIGYTSDRRPKLLDFGLALLDQAQDSHAAAEPLSEGATDALVGSVDPEATVTVGERLVGTPLYLAPEALAGSVPQPSFDLWGLALVLYEAIAGRHPFAADDVGTCASRRGTSRGARHPRLQADLSPRVGVVSARRVVAEHRTATGKCRRDARRVASAPGEHPGARPLSVTAECTVSQPAAFSS